MESGQRLVGVRGSLWVRTVASLVNGLGIIVERTRFIFSVPFCYLSFWLINMSTIAATWQRISLLSIPSWPVSKMVGARVLRKTSTSEQFLSHIIAYHIELFSVRTGRSMSFIDGR